jgi:hypothetical protein
MEARNDCQTDPSTMMGLSMFSSSHEASLFKRSGQMKTFRRSPQTCLWLDQICRYPRISFSSQRGKVKGVQASDTLENTERCRFRALRWCSGSSGWR